MENIYHEAIFQESSNIALNIDVIRLSNKLTEVINSLLYSVKK